MKLAEAKRECEHWFAYLDRQREKTKALQVLASDCRTGTVSEEEKRRRLQKIEGIGVTVYDGAKLEQAVKTLLKHIGSD